MPQLSNDEMIELTDEDKQLIKAIGYKVCADFLGVTNNYLRGLCSKGVRRIRRTHLQRIEQISTEE